MSPMPQNMLVIVSDEQAAQYMGCSGHPIVKTPNLDKLAARGTRFTSAYTNCPICVPARASLATGRYVHELGTWDNAIRVAGFDPLEHRRDRIRGRNTGTPDARKSQRNDAVRPEARE